MRRLTLAAVGIVAGVLAASVWTSSPAQAHAMLAASQPADGETVERGPSEALLTFTEAPDPVLSMVRVLGSSGAPVEVGAVEPVPDEPRRLRLPLGPLPQGAYTVAWRTTSSVDGHTTTGSFTFGVGVPAAASGGGDAARTPTPTALSIGGRWLLDGALAFLVGAAVLGLFVTKNPASIRGLSLGACWAVAVVGLVGLALDQRATARTSFALVFRSATGEKLTAQAVALVAVGLAVAWVGWRRSRPALVALAMASAAAFLTRSLAGHADASSVRWFNVGVQWLHLVAAGAWIGGLVWLLGVLRRGGQQRTVILRRFSSMAGAALGIVVVSGSVRAVDEVAAWDRLVSTGFGQALLVKLGLFAPLAGIGALNRFRNVPAAAAGRLGGLRWAVRAEVAIAVGVLGATAVLAGLPPPASTAAAAGTRSAPRVVATGSDYASTVRVRIAVTPGSTGVNDFSADITDYDSGKLVAAQNVVLRLQYADRPDVGPATLPLMGHHGQWHGHSSALSIAGRWNVTAVVEMVHDAVEVPLEVVIRPQGASR